MFFFKFQSVLSSLPLFPSILHSLPNLSVLLLLLLTPPSTPMAFERIKPPPLLTATGGKRFARADDLNNNRHERKNVGQLVHLWDTHTQRQTHKHIRVQSYIQMHIQVCACLCARMRGCMRLCVLWKQENKKKPLENFFSQHLFPLILFPVSIFFLMVPLSSSGK